MAYLDSHGLETFWAKIKTLVSGKEDSANKVPSISSTSTDDQYPSAKCVYDVVGDIESLLSALR